MARPIAGIFAASALLACGCNHSPSPTQPDPPIVDSAKRIYVSNYNQWEIRGSRFGVGPRVTFESGNAVITMLRPDDMYSYSSDTLVLVEVPAGTPPGAYTPCVTNFRAKGCGQFTVEIK